MKRLEDGRNPLVLGRLGPEATHGMNAITRWGLVVALLVPATLGAAVGPLLAAPPGLVSPVGSTASSCPTFSWSLVPRVRGYELVVYTVSTVSAREKVGNDPIVSAHLPAGASSWTMPAGSCLTPGARYAWTLRSLGKEAPGIWSEPSLFQVAPAPSPDDVKKAIATLRDYLQRTGTEATKVRSSGEDEADDAVRGAGSDASFPTRVPMPRPRGHGTIRSVTEAAVPSLGTASLTVDDHIVLGPASNLIKDGGVFLWDDTSGNTALGRFALRSAVGTATGNTAVGREALRNTTEATNEDFDGSYNTGVGRSALLANTSGRHNVAIGYEALYSNTTGRDNSAAGSQALSSNTEGYRNTANGSRALQSNTTADHNTAIGYRALYGNTTGGQNTATGDGALHSNTDGDQNTATGRRALFENTTGSRNTASGYGAGRNATDGDDNVFLGSGAEGFAGVTNTIQIGGATGTGAGEQNRTFVAGIVGITTGEDDAVPVVIDSQGQLGTMSSSRAVKQEIRDIDDLSKRLLELRPVAFRYKAHAASDPEASLQFGLIAEEVAEVFPELVVFDEEGKPRSVRYHLLGALLLNELQQENRELEEQRRALDAQQREIAGLRKQLTGLCIP